MVNMKHVVHINDRINSHNMVGLVNREREGFADVESFTAGRDSVVGHQELNRFGVAGERRQRIRSIERNLRSYTVGIVITGQ